MSMNTETEVMQSTETGEGQMSEVEQRLAQIAAAMEAKLGSGTAKSNLADGMACPIDPAERALCEGCQ